MGGRTREGGGPGESWPAISDGWNENGNNDGDGDGDGDDGGLTTPGDCGCACVSESEWDLSSDPRPAVVESCSIKVHSWWATR